MRKIKYIAVHCTASSQRTTTIDTLMREFKRKGWKSPGYHYVVKVDGSIHQLLDVEKVSNGVYIKGHSYNSESINVSYIGGIDNEGNPIDNRTEEQKASLRKLLKILKQKYPDAIIQGHRDFSPDLNHDGKISKNEWIKACPCFDAKTEYADL